MPDESKPLYYLIKPKLGSEVTAEETRGAAKLLTNLIQAHDGIKNPSVRGQVTYNGTEKVLGAEFTLGPDFSENEFKKEALKAFKQNAPGFSLTFPENIIAMILGVREASKAEHKRQTRHSDKLKRNENASEIISAGVEVILQRYDVDGERSIQ